MAEYQQMVDLDVEKKFGVCEFQWVVKDLSLLTCGDDDWSVESPVFSVRAHHVTEWHVSLRPATGSLRDECVALVLKRCDAEAALVCAEWKLKVTVSKRDRQIHLKNIFEFAPGIEFLENVKCLKDDIYEIGSLDSDLMTVQCTMIVYDSVPNREFEPCQGRGRLELSEDLFNMFLEGRDCDLRLKCGEKFVAAHKAVVCSRIQYIGHLLESADVVADDEGREVDVVDLSHLDHEAVVRIVQYAYSGDLIHVLGEPSLAVLETVCALDIYHLRRIYGAKELTFRTSHNTRETRLTWSIDEFHDEFEDIVSPDLIDDVSGTAWRLHISCDKNDNPDFLSVSAENIGEVELGDFCVEFSLSDEQGRPAFAKLVRRAERDRTPLRVDRFIRKVTLRNFLAPGAPLRLTMRLKYRGDEASSYVEKQEVTFATAFQKIDPYELLSREIQNLLDVPDFVDLWLTSRDVCYGIHTNIVRSRCPHLSNMINNARDGNKSTLDFVDPDVLFMVLEFIYSGQVVSHIEDMAKVAGLRDAAIELKIPLLIEFCGDVLGPNEN